MTPATNLTPDDFVTIPRVLYDAYRTIAERQADLEQIILNVLDDHGRAAALAQCTCGYRVETPHAWHQHIADLIQDNQ